MKTNKFLLLLVLLSISMAGISQSKKLTMEDAVWNQWFSLRPESLDQLQWLPETHDYVYIKAYSNVYKGTIKKGKDKLWFTLDGVNSVVTKAGLPELPYLYDLKWLDKNTFLDVSDNLVYIFDAEKMKLEQSFVLPDSAENVRYNKEANAVAYTVGNNLQVMTDDGKIIKISDEPNKGIVYGSNYVHRQEWGIDNGIFWSPDGKYLAFYRKDETMVKDYPLIDYTTFPAKCKPIKYPMTGQTNEYVTVGVYDFSTGKTTYMKTDQLEDRFLVSVTWGPESKYMYIGVLNRDQNHLWFNKYQRSDGKFVKTLFEETNPKYVEPLHPAYFLPKTKNEFVWISRRSGFYHLYLYDTDGNLIRQLTDGQWSVTDYYGMSPDEKYVFFQSTAECPIQRHIYRVGVKDGKMKMLTKIHGVHNAKFSDDFKFFVNDYSNIEIPHIQTIVNNNGKEVKKLLEASDPLAEYNLGKMKIGKIKAADGKTDLYYRLITPPNLDTTKKYPAIIYVYGGPHVQLILDSWLADARLWQFYMAQEGYVMLTVDNRGSYNRGMDFESVTFRHLGVEEMKDQMKGVEFLASLPYVDTSRLGVHGWSFGGFMTTSLTTTYPGVFKVAVAGGPVIDWKYYEIMYGERYMDTPQTNPEGYKETSVLNKIQNLKGKLMIIHGGIDPVVVPQNTRSLLLKAQKLDIDVDFYEFPNSEHNVRGRERILLMQKITDYFNTYLK